MKSDVKLCDVHLVVDAPFWCGIIVLCCKYCFSKDIYFIVVSGLKSFAQMMRWLMSIDVNIAAATVIMAGWDSDHWESSYWRTSVWFRHWTTILSSVWVYPTTGRLFPIYDYLCDIILYFWV